ncbi:MAG TPA: hypothetical protein VN729_13665, partial [Ktedonobacteraceae bacterium]|nr:hypothetical protein [Ktedonobacteraceae bacterium]
MSGKRLATKKHPQNILHHRMQRRTTKREVTLSRFLPEFFGKIPGETGKIQNIREKLRPN